jgi:hypothetical protein
MGQPLYVHRSARTHARTRSWRAWVQGMSAVESGLPRTDAHAQVAFASERVPRWRPVEGTLQLSPHGSEQGHGKALCVQVLPVIAVPEPTPVTRSFSFVAMMEALSIPTPVLPAGHLPLPCAPHLPLPFGLVSPPLQAAPSGPASAWPCRARHGWNRPQFPVGPKIVPLADAATDLVGQEV